MPKENDQHYKPEYDSELEAELDKTIVMDEEIEQATELPDHIKKTFLTGVAELWEKVRKDNQKVGDIFAYDYGAVESGDKPVTAQSNLVQEVIRQLTSTLVNINYRSYSTVIEEELELLLHESFTQAQAQANNNNK